MAYPKKRIKEPKKRVDPDRLHKNRYPTKQETLEEWSEEL